MRNRTDRARQILFWSWNIIFASFVTIGMMPIIGSEVLYGLRMGTINKDLAVFLGVAIAMPAMALILGFSLLRKDSRKLFDLMYCIEIPVLVLTLFRIFFLRDITTGVGFFLTLFGLSSLYFAFRLLWGNRPDSYPNLIGATVFLWCGAWIFLVLLFLIPPMAYGVFTGSKTIIVGVSRLSLADLARTFTGLFFVLFGAVFLIYTATLFVLFPLVYISSSFTNWRAAADPLYKVNKKSVIGVTVGTLAITTAIFVLSTQQNHSEILTRLQGLSGSESDKNEVGSAERYYRTGLRDIYLAPYRYMGDYSKSDFIQDIYHRTFGLSPESTEWIQKLFNSVARPFIYSGSSNGMAHDQKLAEKLYGDIFDSSIQEDERETIRYAVQSTYSREQIDAGLININEKKVHLESQDVSLTEDGEWADVEIHEAYYNPSSRPEEVFLHLKLPKGAVINGLWLSDDETKKFPANVAPRGAAQKVYKEIVKRGADPALVEQVGPQLYRLRVFPIPSNDLRYREKQVMHMWLKLRLLKESPSTWQLPLLTEKRNLFWDQKTRFTFNGVRRETETEWLPTAVPANQPSVPVKQARNFGSQTIEMQPFDDSSLAQHCSLAVIIDTSFSMRPRATEILNAKEAIDRTCRGSGVEYFVWNNGFSRIETNLQEQIEKRAFWGVFGSGDLTKSFFPNGSKNKHVLVITDRTFFRETEKKSDYSLVNQPLWVLLLDRRYPRSIDDDLLKRLYEVGGGIETDWHSVSRAMARFDLKTSQKDVVDVGPRYIWRISDNKPPSSKIDGGGEPLLAHQLILHSIERGLAKDETALDQLHKIALQAVIVSPFSSMIVLVDEAQKQMLAKAQEEKDRFDRKVETGKELLTSPKAPFEATAVPEPEEWALLIAASGFLLFHFHRRRSKIRRGHGVAI